MPDARQARRQAESVLLLARIDAERTGLAGSSCPNHRARASAISRISWPLCSAENQLRVVALGRNCAEFAIMRSCA